MTAPTLTVAEYRALTGRKANKYHRADKPARTYDGVSTTARRRPNSRRGSIS